jgi:Putative addiction module component
VLSAEDVAAKLVVVTQAAQDFLRDVLELSEGDRLDIVAEVLARLDGPPDPAWEAAWLAELDRRDATELREPSADEEWSVVRARILTGATRRDG